MGKLVSVPFDQIRLENDKAVTRGATKACRNITATERRND